MNERQDEGATPQLSTDEVDAQFSSGNYQVFKNQVEHSAAVLGGTSASMKPFDHINLPDGHLRGAIDCAVSPPDIADMLTEKIGELDSALSVQIGGSHYKDCAIQPVEFIEANNLQFLEGCIIKRVTRHNKSTGKGRQDIEKAIHELQLLLELRYGN